MSDGRERTTESMGPIQSVERAAAVLDLFSPSQPRWTLPELTERLSASRATVHRYLVALRTAGLLRYDEATSVYTLGPEVLRLAAAALVGLPVVDVAGPFMRELAQSTGETAVLSVWDRQGPVIVRVEHVLERIVHIHIRTGARLEATTSAQGRMFLAHLRADETSLAGTVAKSELQEIRDAGLAVSDRVEPGIRAVAAPVFDGEGIAAVLAIVGTEASLPADRHSLAATRLIDAAKQISEAIGSPKNVD